MRSVWRSVRLFVRDLFLHYIQGSLCLLRRRHRALVYVGEIGKKGFRGVPIYQCAKCTALYIHDRDALRLGGTPPGGRR